MRDYYHALAAVTDPEHAPREDISVQIPVDAELACSIVGVAVQYDPCTADVPLVADVEYTAEAATVIVRRPRGVSARLMRYAIACQLGHLILHVAWPSTGVNAPRPRNTAEARRQSERFAAGLLLPEGAYLEALDAARSKTGAARAGNRVGSRIRARLVEMFDVPEALIVCKCGQPRKR